MFNRYCKRVNEIFAIEEIVSAFSAEKWSALPKTHKHKHSLSKYAQCALTHHDEQHSFPGPKYTPGAQSVDILKKQLGDSCWARTPLLQCIWTLIYWCPHVEQWTFKGDLLKQRNRRQNTWYKGNVGIIFHNSFKIVMLLQFLQKHSHWLHTNDSIMQSLWRAQSVLVCMLRDWGQEGHSPKFENVQWHKEGHLYKLKKLAPTINWSALGVSLAYQGKEFALENGIDVSN